jgi:hypothetical protein
LYEVIAFLDTLTYGNQSTPGMAETFAEWREKSRFARSWQANE